MENVDFVEKRTFHKKTTLLKEKTLKSHSDFFRTSRGRWHFLLLIVVTLASARASWGAAQSLSHSLLLLRKLLKVHPLQHPDCSQSCLQVCRDFLRRSKQTPPIVSTFYHFSPAECSWVSSYFIRFRWELVKVALQVERNINR